MALNVCNEKVMTSGLDTTIFSIDYLSNVKEKLIFICGYMRLNINLDRTSGSIPIPCAMKHDA